MCVMSIHSNIRDYKVFFGETTEFLESFDRFPQRCCVVDENVWSLHRSGCLAGLDSKDVIVFPVSEERKNLEAVCELYDLLTKYAAKRNMTVISIGGGILQDITGFVVSTLYRGINWVFIPTSLLAQADSCIGSKTSLNYKGFKNLIGTFYPPSEIYIYTPFLATLQEVDFFSGLGEVVKLHLMGGADKTREIMQSLPGIVDKAPKALMNAVRNSLNIKHGYISDDEFDSGRRNLLNFGHCFGHALESTSNFRIPHGQAVVIGMLLANVVARNRAVLSDELHRFIAESLLLPTLAVRPTEEYFGADAIIQAMKKDKKRTGDKLALVMFRQDYSLLRVDDLTESEVSDALVEAKDTLA